MRIVAIVATVLVLGFTALTFHGWEAAPQNFRTKTEAVGWCAAVMVRGETSPRYVRECLQAALWTLELNQLFREEARLRREVEEGLRRVEESKQKLLDL
jgi:TRAP-type C4-dicarboxylate transport system permease small subunit